MSDLKSLPKNLHYQIYTTGDGSPTLYLTREEDGYIEKMHNAKGAYAESLYIYGGALDQILDRNISETLTVGSLGLGLAYNEIISIARLTARNIALFKLVSFEKDKHLTNQFLNWVNDVPSKWSAHYDWILQQTSKDHSLSAEQLKQGIKNSIENKNWQIRGEFPTDLTTEDQFHLFYYDAFSNKMSPELWIEDQLKDFVRNHTAQNSMLSTYAATGALKRALKENNFKLLERPGFGGKRESILGIR